MNIYEKLIEVRKAVPYLKKDNKFVGSGEKLAECEDRLTMEVAKIIVNPPRDLPVKQGSVCDEGAP